MSWQIGLIVASSAMQAIQQKKAAKAQEFAANVRAQQFATQAKAARLQAQQQEVERRRDLAELEATNNATVSYDAFTSPSFLALKKENKAALDRDITNIQLMGAMKGEQADLGQTLALSSAKSARSAGNFALVGAALGIGGKLGKFAGGPSGATGSPGSFSNPIGGANTTGAESIGA